MLCALRGSPHQGPQHLSPDQACLADVACEVAISGRMCGAQLLAIHICFERVGWIGYKKRPLLLEEKRVLSMAAWFTSLLESAGLRPWWGETQRQVNNNNNNKQQHWRGAYNEVRFAIPRSVHESARFSRSFGALLLLFLLLFCLLDLVPRVASEGSCAGVNAAPASLTRFAWTAISDSGRWTLLYSSLKRLASKSFNSHFDIGFSSSVNSRPSRLAASRRMAF